MQIPSFIVESFEKLLKNLEDLLTKANAVPVRNEKLLDLTEFSQDKDILAAQHYYAMVWLIVKVVIPIFTEGSIFNIPSSMKEKIPAIVLHFNALNVENVWSHAAASLFAESVQKLSEKLESSKELTIKAIMGVLEALEFKVSLLTDQLALILGNKQNVQANTQRIFQEIEKGKTELLQINKTVTTSPYHTIENYQLISQPNKADFIQVLLAQKQNLEQFESTRNHIIQLKNTAELFPQKVLIIAEGNLTFIDRPDTKDIPDTEPLRQEIAKKHAATVTLIGVVQNEMFFAQIHDNLIAQINVIRESIKKIPANKYSINEHQEYLAAISALKTIDFPALTTPEKLLQSKYAKESENIRQTYSKLVEQQKEELAKEILAKQKQCFSTQLKQALENAFTRARDEKLVDPGLKPELIESAKGNETELDKLQTFYSDCDNWLKGQLSYHNLKQMAEGWVKDTLKNDDAAQQLLRGFTSEDYKPLSESIKKLAEALEKVIASGQLKLDMANTTKVDKLKQEVEAQTKRIAEYTAAFKGVTEKAQKLSEQHQLDYKTAKEKLGETNSQITQLLRQRNQFSDILKESPINESDLAQLNGQSINIKNRSVYEATSADLANLIQQKNPNSASFIAQQLESLAAQQEKLLTLQTLITQRLSETRTSYDTNSNREKIGTINTFLQSHKDSLGSSLGNTELNTLASLIKTEHESTWPGYSVGKLEENCQEILKQAINKQQQQIENYLAQSNAAKNLKKFIDEKIEEHKNYAQLRDLDNQLVAKITEKSALTQTLQNLPVLQAQELSDLYKGLSIYLPKETVVTQGEESKTHQNNLSTMSCELNLTKAKIALIEFKKPAVEQQANLNKIQQDLNSLQINSTTFQYKPDSPASFNDQWQTHTQQINQAIAASRQSITAIDEQLNKVYKADTALVKQLNAITQILKQTEQEIQTSKIPQLSGLPPLIEAKNAAHKELMGLRERTYQIKNLRQKKTTALQVQQNIYGRETLAAPTHQTNLLAAEQCKTNITTQTNLLAQHQYDANTITDLTQGRKPADFILQEDQFYRSCQTQYINLQKEIYRLKGLLVIPHRDGLTQAFNKELTTKINECQTQLDTLNQTRAVQANTWQMLSQKHNVISHSRKVLQEQQNPPPNRNYTGYDLRGIQLANGSFAGIPIQNANLSYATLTNFTFDDSLSGVNLSHANVSTCTFTAQANFQGVILDTDSQLNWPLHGEKIWRDNQLANPYATNVNDPTQATYLTNLITLVSTKCNNQPNKLIELTRSMLQAIAAIPKPHNSSEEDHLNALQQRAVWFMQKMVPQLSFKDLIELGHELATTKHDDDANPYGFIRRELDTLRCKYGNTRPWQQIMTPIKERLHSLATEIADAHIQNNEDDQVIVQAAPQQQQHPKILPQDYTKFMTIMRSQTVHTYGFGKIAFFFTPAHNFEQHWEQREHDLVQPQQDNNETKLDH